MKKREKKTVSISELWKLPSSHKSEGREREKSGEGEWGKREGGRKKEREEEKQSKF